MGFFSRIPLWVFLLNLGCVEGSYTELVFSTDQHYRMDAFRGFVGRSLTDEDPDFAEHSRNIISTGIDYGMTCSYWNDFHYMAFTGEVFFFPGNCTYSFVYHCKNPPESFSIQIAHIVANQSVLYTKITLKINTVVVEMHKDNITVDGTTVTLPYSRPLLTIQRINSYIKLVSLIGLVLMKSDDGRFELQLDEKYANQTCGLCGDPVQSSIFENNDDPISYGNSYKVDVPNEECPDVLPKEMSCSQENHGKCENHLRDNIFSNCHEMIEVEPFVDACALDLCQCKRSNSEDCMCSTVAEYSHQCILQRGLPQNWRTSDFCPKSCPQNMEYKECGSPCSNSCSDPERENTCDMHCIEGCFCQNGLIYDDISSQDCIKPEECPCTYNDKIYGPQKSYSTACRTCKCFNGKWNCTLIPCSGTCSIEGGTHITTFDQFRYTVYGDCQYVIVKENRFIILGDMKKCGTRETSVCLLLVTIIMGGTTLKIYPDGTVTVNEMKTTLPIYTESYMIFNAANEDHYVFQANNFGMQAVIQLKPIMQVYIVLDPSFKTKTTGICGNFNNNQRDDLMTMSGVIEGTPSTFVNTWKVSALCPNINHNFDDPCSINVESADYANFWCGQISDSSGNFSPCHGIVDPLVYKQNCITDTCSCAKLEDCMCAAIASYVKICAAKGVFLNKWKLSPCNKFIPICPDNQNYGYTITSCKPTCRSLNDNDATCNIHFDPLPGCICKKGFYENDQGKCVPASACPCYVNGIATENGETISENGVLCTCTKGKLNCLNPPTKDCVPPMVFANCSNSNPGAECAKSCQTLDMQCYMTRCIPGCVCPSGLVSDERGGCIPEDDCPCFHNTAAYKSGEEIQIRCNTCVCKKRKWECTTRTCLATCVIYGNGHYITFDGKRYVFNGECQYTLSQDHCSLSDSNSTFKIITQNVPCGNMGATCSKSIKVFLEDYELILVDDHLNLAQRGSDGEVPYRVRLMGIYLVIETKKGLLIFWDKKSSIFIKVTSDYKGKICGLCGIYDGNRNNDFTTRNNAVVANTEEFGNSWKLSPTCADGKVYRDACSLNPYRNAWAHRKCSIINSEVFSTCHPHVDPSKYYEACVSDSCACNTGGDCECFCTAVAAYAQACGEYNICVAWRSPTICPLFCDYYNSLSGQDCEWHYRPCGAPCMKTCRNPNGKCHFEIRGLEGCYPKCPEDRPYFDEDDMKCVAQCGCYDMNRKHYPVGAIVPSDKNCYFCNCTMEGIICQYVVEECKCEYHGRMYNYNETVINGTDSANGCLLAICRENGTIYFYDCPSSTSEHTTTTVSKTTTITTETSTPTTSTTTSTTTPTQSTLLTTPCTPTCTWTEWFDEHNVTFGRVKGGDFESPEVIRKSGKNICYSPSQIECRSKVYPEKSLEELQQNVMCQLPGGLECYNKDQITNGGLCYNYEVRFLCCENLCQPKTTTPTASLTTSNQTSPPVTCTPRCVWTPWFNLHYPTFGPDGSEVENIQLIKQSGSKICTEPFDIDCRAKAYPDFSLVDLQQKVTCNLETGFKCLNSEQYGMCYDYEIRYLCCDDRSHCATTTPVTTVCRCTVDGSVFFPGSIISNKTDAFGCYILTICNINCVIEQQRQENCPSTTTYFTTSTSTATSTTSSQPTTSTASTTQSTTSPTSTQSTTSTASTTQPTTSPTSTQSTTSTTFTTQSTTSPTSTQSTTVSTTQPTTSPTSSQSTTSTASTTQSTTSPTSTQSTTVSTTQPTTSPTSSQSTTSTASTTQSTTSPTSTQSTTVSTTQPTTSPTSSQSTTSTASTTQPTTSPTSTQFTTSTASTTQSTTSPTSTTSTASTTQSTTSPTSTQSTTITASTTQFTTSSTSTQSTTSTASTTQPTTSPTSTQSTTSTASTTQTTTSPTSTQSTTSTASTTQSTTSPTSTQSTTSTASTTQPTTSPTSTQSTTSTASTTPSTTSPTSTQSTTSTASTTQSTTSPTSTQSTTSTASTTQPTTSPTSTQSTTSTASTTQTTTSPTSTQSTTSTASTTQSTTSPTSTQSTTSTASTTQSTTSPTSTQSTTSTASTTPSTTSPTSTQSTTSTASTTQSTTSPTSTQSTTSTASTTQPTTSPTSTQFTTSTTSTTQSTTSPTSTQSTTSTASTTQPTTSPTSTQSTTSTASTTQPTTSPTSTQSTTSTASTTQSTTSPTSTQSTTSTASTTQPTTSPTSTQSATSTVSTTHSTTSLTSTPSTTQSTTSTQPTSLTTQFTTSSTSAHSTTSTTSRTQSTTSITKTTTAEGCPPRKPGEYWIQGCNNCTCDAMTLAVICKPITCPDVTVPICTKPGFVLVDIQDPSNPCCMKKACFCNVSSCPPSNKLCQNPGEKLIANLMPGDCCPTYECVTEPCTVHNTSKVIEKKNCKSSGPVELTYCEGGCMSSSGKPIDNDMTEDMCRCCRPFKTSNRTATLTCSDGTKTLYTYTYVDECQCLVPQCEEDNKSTSKEPGKF